MSIRPRLTALVVLWTLVVTVAPVQAYVDPGSGSLVVQAILGGLAGLLVLGGIFWRRLMGWFKRDRRSSGAE